MTPASDLAARDMLIERRQQLTHVHRISPQPDIRALVADIDEALQRFERGTYGVCDVCKDHLETDHLEDDPLALSCREHLAGCLYVLEGACLGGQVVAKALRRQLELAKGSGASFFVGDADGTAARWRFVLTWLESLVRAGAPAEQIVASARATFLALARWLEQQRVSR